LHRLSGSGTTGVGQLSFAEVSGGTSYQAVKTSGFTAVAGEGYFCNTTSAAFTATLPSSGTIGDEITFIDYAGTFDTNNLTSRKKLTQHTGFCSRFNSVNRESRFYIGLRRLYSRLAIKG
jgi:hypothetical protein